MCFSNLNFIRCTFYNFQFAALQERRDVVEESGRYHFNSCLNCVDLLCVISFFLHLTDFQMLVRQANKKIFWNSFLSPMTVIVVITMIVLMITLVIVKMKLNSLVSMSILEWKR